MTSQTGQQIIEIHILPNISRSKGSQAVKYGQFKKYSIRNILLANHTQNVVKKLVPDPFIKDQN